MRVVVLIFLIWVLTFPRLAMAGSNPVETKFIKAGLVDVTQYAPNVKIDLVNSNPKKNFFRDNYYLGLQKAYLQKEVAIMLSKAQDILQARKPGYRLQILDAARPRSISKKMYEKMKGTIFEKFVANPKSGSMHNYGIAVDITIIDEKGKDIDMGETPFKRTKFQIYCGYLKSKLGFSLDKKQIANRKLLNNVMKDAGFIPLSFEWWHFDGMPKEHARKKYKIIE